jgi:hypothetical protein
MHENPSKVFQEFLGADTCSRVDGQFHLVDLLVDLLHELNDEVYQLVLVHLLRVLVGDQEADVVALNKKIKTIVIMMWMMISKFV